MDEYISKAEAIEAIRQTYCPNCNSYNGSMCRACGYKDCMDIVDDVKAADVKPVKYSSWEYRTYPIVDRDGVARRCMRGYVCKACGHGEPEEKRFCGGCGAEMQNE